MYWDVVEVKPEPGHRLFIRFKDGLSGLVRLAEEELIGALAPLRDEDFFRQVFIDQGAVAWPGEIDLAPDAMHADLAAQRQAALNTSGPAIIDTAIRHLEKERDEIKAKITRIRAKQTMVNRVPALKKAATAAKAAIRKSHPTAAAAAGKETTAQKRPRSLSRPRSSRRRTQNL